MYCRASERASGVSWCGHAQWADTKELLQRASKQAICGMERRRGTARRFGFDRLLRVRVLLYCCNERESGRGRAPATGATESEIQINRHLSGHAALQLNHCLLYSSSLRVLLDYNSTIFKLSSRQDCIVLNYASIINDFHLISSEFDYWPLMDITSSVHNIIRAVSWLS